LIVCVAVVKFPQASVIVYVLVTTIGQVPADVSALVTTKVASEVQASETEIPNNTSKATTVETGDGAADAEHP
jgi:hypothetical protein